MWWGYYEWAGKRFVGGEDNWSFGYDLGSTYLNDWNEWTAGKYQPGGGATSDFMRRKSPYYFVDQYNSEFNRAIQPMHGGYTDNYYMQMAQNIRRYKGVRPIPENRGFHRIKVNETFKDWAKVAVEYLDTVGDTCGSQPDGRVVRHG